MSTAPSSDRHPPDGPTGRRARQLAEILALAESGSRRRAGDLLQLHLAEFPDDAHLFAEHDVT